MRLTISKDFTFEASHVLPRHPGKCSRLHGHSWKLTVGVSGLVDPTTGFVMDYGDLSSIVKLMVIDVLDHRHLGQGYLQPYSDLPAAGDEEVAYSAVISPDFYPSSENLVAWIVEQLQIPELDWQGCQLEFVTLHETCTSACTWRRSDAAVTY